MAIEETLANVELFADLAPEDLARLARICVSREYKAGDVLVREGELGIAFYVVARGSVEVIRGLDTPNEQVVATIGANGFFGEMALFDNHLRSASARAKEDTECLMLTRWDFDAELTASGGRIAMALLRVLARRIRALNESAATH